MRVQLNGTAIHYQIEGPSRAPWVVLIHGFPFSRQAWSQTANALKKQYRVLTYDLRGMGMSPLGQAPQTLENYVDDLLALLKFLKIKKCFLAGLSMGGYIALRAIHKEPGRFFALGLFDTKAEADSNEARLGRSAAIDSNRRRGLKPFVEGMLPKLLVSKGRARSGLKKIMLANTVQGVCNALAAMQGRLDSTGYLKDIKVPTLILSGDKDQLTPPAVAKSMAAAIPASTLIILKNAGHVSSQDQPGPFSLALLNFLKKL
jgi:pimeloyl-ACP methyl ester carboxylesterase